MYADMRLWQAPRKADILVSELLGSFGDNELSPECLDGAQRFLQPDGISIPQSYTSFMVIRESLQRGGGHQGGGNEAIPLSFSTSLSHTQKPTLTCSL